MKKGTRLKVGPVAVLVLLALLTLVRLMQVSKAASAVAWELNPLP
jgi:hypothetical protein